MAETTYIFRNGNVYTLVDNKVVASVKEADFADPEEAAAQAPTEMPDPPADIQDDLGEVPCPTCGSPSLAQDKFCSQCGGELIGHAPGQSPEEQVPGAFPGSPGIPGNDPQGDYGNQALAKQTVTTPNGLKGRVLASIPGIWGDEVTVRFENGVIKRIPVDKSLTFTAAEEDPTADSSVKGLEERLAASALSDRESLIERAAELKKIKSEANALVAESSDGEIASLDRISVEADYELREVQEALDHFAANEGQGFEAPAPIANLPAVQQASLGGSEASWLDHVAGEMVHQASETDYKKLMDEGPEAFVAGLDDTQLADASTTRSMAALEIRSHTAGAVEEVRDNYEKVFLARVEAQRRERLASRKEEVRKEASSEESPSVPDESLFLS